MTYQNKTIKRHVRGNWFARVRFGKKVISVYGKTKIDCYDKLKLVVDRIEQEKVISSANRYLEKVNGLIPQNYIQVANTQVMTENKQAQSFTLQEWFDEWLNSYKVGRVRPASITAFKRAFKNFEPLHNTDIKNISSLMLSKEMNKISGQGMKTQVCNLAQQMFKVAFNNRLIEFNPAGNFTMPKYKAVGKKIALTQEQEQKLIDLCLKDPDQYAPFIVCCLQGLRKGEMLALRPNDLNFEQNTLRVDESYDENYPDDLMTKNRDSMRTMPMFEITKQVLLKYADYPPQERIFTSKTAVLYKRLAKLLKQSDLPKITIHELRHTFISRCHEKGIDEIIVQRWVGHAIGSAMTKAVYTHISNDTEKSYIAKMNGNDNDKSQN